MVSKTLKWVEKGKEEKNRKAQERNKRERRRKIREEGRDATNDISL